VGLALVDIMLRLAMVLAIRSRPGGLSFYADHGAMA
jgi:hypothetical protein